MMGTVKLNRFVPHFSIEPVFSIFLALVAVLLKVMHNTPFALKLRAMPDHESGVASQDDDIGIVLSTVEVWMIVRQPFVLLRAKVDDLGVSCLSGWPVVDHHSEAISEFENLVTPLCYEILKHHNQS